MKTERNTQRPLETLNASRTPSRGSNRLESQQILSKVLKGHIAQKNGLKSMPYEFTGIAG